MVALQRSSEGSGHVCVFSTDEDEAEGLASMLEGRVVSCESRRLESLESFCFDGCAVAILVHFVEGRTLLVDTDGSYNRFLVEAISACGGHVVVILRGVDMAHDTVVSELVAAGQRSVLVFDRSGRFLTWGDAPIEAQLRHIEQLCSRRAAPVSATDEMTFHAGGPSSAFHYYGLDESKELLATGLVKTGIVARAVASFLVDRCSLTGRCAAADSDDDDEPSDDGEVTFNAILSRDTRPG